MFAFVGIINYQSLSNLTASTIFTNTKSYQEAATESYGMWLSHLIGFLIMFSQMGAMAASFVIIGDTMTPVVNVVFSDFSSHILLSRNAVILYSLFIILPLAYPRQINTLRTASTFAVVAFFYLAGLVVVKSIIYLSADGTPPIPDVREHKFEFALFGQIPVIFYAYGCSVQTIPVFDELRDRTLKMMNKVIVGGMGMSFVLYFTVGLFGYLQFRDDVVSNILNNYTENNDPFVIIGRVSIALAIALGFPMSSWPFRNTCEQFYLYAKHKYIPKEIITVPIWVNIIESVLIVGVSLIIGIFVKNLSQIFGLVGSTSSMLLGFIIPALMYNRLLPASEPYFYVKKGVSCFLLILGVTIGVMGVASNIMSYID